MNVNKPLLFGKDGVMLKKVKETKIDTYDVNYKK